MTDLEDQAGELVALTPLDGGRPLVYCPRCRGWSRNPESHILGPAVRWQGGPLPMIRYCTPFGVELRPISPAAAPPVVGWGWTADGFRPTDGQEDDE